MPFARRSLDNAPRLQSRLQLALPVAG